MVTIREERERDADGIDQVHCSAFPTPAEARLVGHLREAGAICASVVAVAEEVLVGHALISQAHIEFEFGSLAVGGLGPVGVLPEWQLRGIGGRLIRAGLERCWALGLPAMIVLGRPDYYGRFGFRRADSWAIRCEFDARAEAFMIAWSATPRSGPGVAKYHPAFEGG
jgi:putative acetyltransferase